VRDELWLGHYHTAIKNHTGMIKSTILFATFLVTLGAHAQSITGTVRGDDSAPLPYASVLLLNPTDSALIKGAVSDTLGVFVIDDVPIGTYLLSASMVGYEQSFISPVKITSEKKTVTGIAFDLREDSKQLQEVVVVEKRPFVEQYIDKMVVNVANSIIASGSTALEVLEKAPGVTVDRQNNSLQLRGKAGVIVQMDGKQTYLSMEDLVNLLSTMSSDNIVRLSSSPIPPPNMMRPGIPALLISG
jgi:Carboxypeptidase regulatory-like domain